MSAENVGGLVALLACPCCSSAAQLSDEYEDCDGNPAVECSQCNLLSWGVSDWNTRALSAHGQTVVDEDMVERALIAYQAVSYGCNTRALRAAITAALGGNDHG